MNEDWLANTADPTPLFSLLVYSVQRAAGQPAVFYLIYAVLIGIYFYCLVGIADCMYSLRRSAALRLFYLALLLTVHSAAWRDVLSALMGNNWAYIIEDGLADQRLLGPVLQPSVFGVLLILSIYLFLENRQIWAVLAAALAATFHPTYLLPAGMLVLAYMLQAYREERSLKTPVTLGGVALLAVTPIVVYTILSFNPSNTQAYARAQQILVSYRIPHHAVIREWFDATAVFKVLWICTAIYLMRASRLALIMGVPFLLGTGLTLVQLFSGSNSLALLFPWRVSALLVPLATAVILAWIIDSLARRFEPNTRQTQLILTGISIGLIGAVLVAGIYRTHLEFQAQQAGSDRPLLEHIVSNRQSGETYLIPFKMQDFRLASGAAAFIEFKAIPYKDKDVIEWYRRMQLSNRFYLSQDCSLLEKLAKQGVTHIIQPIEQSRISCSNLRQEYRDSSYALYRLEKDSNL